MITAWSPSGMQRSRSSAALWRVLGLGLCLFGLLYTHAVSPGATVSHLTAEGGVWAADAHFEPFADDTSVASATPAQPAHEEPADHHDGHGQQHTGEDCALGQPPQGPAVALPCLSPLHSDTGDDAGAPRPAHSRHSSARDAVAPITHAAHSAVLRI
ncbi:hypothetical protein [Streptomyces sp. NPDC046909]|uniref:hypothetical protein n=1 Tax=Streptomyces sp. NPDC046909 TaxID=3155617 RepID=UPI0033F4627D